MISFYTPALLLLRRPPCWTHDTARHVTTHTTCRACRVVTYGDVMQQVEFGLMWKVYDSMLTYYVC